MTNARRTEDYEASEETAIADGKKALSKAPWLYDRRVSNYQKGFFVELRENDAVHPEWYSCHCVDGVGTKLFLSAWSGDFSLPSIDALAMNANDLATIIKAYPSELNLYFAVQTEVEKQHMEAIMQGFVAALEKIRIADAPFGVNMGKIETASLDEMISLGVPNKGWDVGVVLNGYIHKRRVLFLTQNQETK